jgi:predicted phosphodiesterase
MRRLMFVALLAVLATPVVPAQDLRLPMKDASLKFAVVGDTGTGDKHQYAVGQQMFNARAKFKFEFVVMAGDNMYGSDKPADFVKKFEKPYKPLLDAGVKFYAALGNHDNAANQINYKPFNMGGQQYYSFRPKLGVRFFALDSNYMDQKQLAWFEKELTASGSDWKIAYFHHPLYASGMHGSNMELRKVLEPLFVKYGVTVVITGHEHFYERIKPQQGIQHFVVGGSAKLRKGDLEATGLTAKGDDRDYSFMLCEIVDNTLHFQVLTESGQTIDSGVVQRTDTMSSGKPAVRTTGTTGKSAPAPAAKPRP